MVLDEPKKDQDKVYDLESLRMVIDSALLTRLGTVSVDYRDSAWRSGFSVTSANDIRDGSSGGCGSGASCC